MGDKKYFKDIAEYIKTKFDEEYKGSWHVIVGSYTQLIFNLKKYLYLLIT